MLPNFIPKGRSKSKFSNEEDKLLLELVNKFGNENWALIASKIKGRSTRQCRERYINYLCPSVNNSPWTEEEDSLLAEKYKTYGPHWKAIADFFPNRTDINVKNRWLRLERHRLKDMKTQKPKPVVIEPKNVAVTPKEKPKLLPPPPLSSMYAGDTWVRFAEPLVKAVEADDFSIINEDVIKYFKALAL